MSRDQSPAVVGVAPSSEAQPSEAQPPEALPERGVRGLIASLRLRDFRYLALSTLAAGFAQWAKQLALFALVYDMTGSAVQLGVVAAFRGAIGTVIAPYGGYLSDRFPRRVVVILSSFLDVVMAGVLAALVLADQAQMWHIYAIALGGGVAQAVNQPARQAFVYDVTTDETLPNAIAVSSIVQNISRVAGPSAFGVMMAMWGVASALVALVVLQFIAIFFTMRIGHATRQTRLGADAQPLRMMREGFRYCWEDKRILGLVVVALIPSLFVYPYMPFLKVVSEEVLDRGNAGFGLLSSMLGWGSLVGLVALAYVASVGRRGLLMCVCWILYAALLIGFAASSNYALSLSILATAGIFHSIGMAINLTLLQQTTRNDMRGRVMAVSQMTFGVQTIGTFPMAFAVEGFGVQVGIGLFMVMATLSFVAFAVGWHSVRRMA